MTWFLFSILALVSLSLYELLSRVAGTNTRHPQAFAAVYNAIAALLIFPLVLITGVELTNISVLVIIIVAINLLVWGLFGRIEYIVHQQVDASTLAIVLKLAPALSFLVGTIFLSEVLTVSKIIGVILIMMANLILLATLQQMKLDLKDGLGYALVLALLLGLGWVFDKFSVGHISVIFFSFISFLSAAVFSAVTPLIPLSVMKTELQHSVKHMVILAFLNVVGYIALLQALSMGEASRVVPIATSTTPLVVLMGIWLLKEKTHITVKISGALLTVVSIWLLR